MHRQKGSLVSLFDSSQLPALSRVCTIKRLAEGEKLMRQGDTATFLGFVMTGRLKVSNPGTAPAHFLGCIAGLESGFCQESRRVPAVGILLEIYFTDAKCGRLSCMAPKRLLGISGQGTLLGKWNCAMERLARLRGRIRYERVTASSFTLRPQSQICMPVLALCPSCCLTHATECDLRGS